MYETEGTDPPKVVIVEDETDLANLFAVWLGKSHTVEIATDCEAAYELFDHSVDVALLDRNLPDGTGDELLTFIRHRGLDCRVAMVTGVEPSLDIVEMGFDEYLCKPVSEDELLDTVGRLVAQEEYRDGIAELFSLTTKKALLESHCTAAELAASEEFAALEARIDELDSQLSHVVNRFSDTQLAAEFSHLSSEGIEG